MPQTITFSTTDNELNTINIADISQITDGSHLGEKYGATITMKDKSVFYTQENLAELLNRIEQETT